MDNIAAVSGPDSIHDASININETNIAMHLSFVFELSKDCRCSERPTIRVVLLNTLEI